jgi:type IV pilus assembly protein PilV
VSPTVKTGHRHSQRGTTLIETLVALLVLSIGLLGVAGLQLTSLRNNRSAHLRSQAQVMAYDITDRMRANRKKAIDNAAYNIAIGVAGTGGTLAGDDVVRWKAALRDSLPSGDGSVEVVNTNVVLITVQWVDQLSSTAQQFTTRTRI